MSRNKTGIYIIGLFILIIGFLFFFNFVKGFSGKSIEKNNQEQYQELSALWSDETLNYQLYWIGDAPEIIVSLSQEEGVNGRISIIPYENLSRDNMPVKWPEMAMREYDQNGNLIREVIPRDYAENMFIVVNSLGMTENITDSQLELIRDSASDNKVPVIILGSRLIYQFREALMLADKNYSDDSSMQFVSGRGSTDNPVSVEVISSNDNGRSMSIDILNYIMNYWTVN